MMLFEKGYGYLISGLRNWFSFYVFGIGVRKCNFKRKKMCVFKVWYQTEEDVYVVECTDCHSWQVRLHSTALMFDRFTYRIFYDTVVHLYEGLSKNQKNGKIQVPALSNGSELVLTVKEFENLYHLLDGADSEMKTENLTKLFYQTAK